MLPRKQHKLSLWGLLAFLVGLFSGSMAYASALGEIKTAIQEKGARWIAEETSVSLLSDHRKNLRFGVILPEVAGWGTILPLQESLGSLPASLDWRANGGSYVTPVKDQVSGVCGSCWAFATTAALESNILIRDSLPGLNEDRAEEILLSCSTAGNCERGQIDQAADFIRETGLPPEWYFPYTASPGDNQCSNALGGWESRAARIVGWRWVTLSNPVNIEAIKHALNAYGPVVTTFIVFTDFNYYRGGIYEHVAGTYEDGHAVLVVGYVDDPSVGGGGYFIAKNSWGTSWGEDGYFRIAYSQSDSPVYFGRWTIAYETQRLSVQRGTVGTEITIDGVSFGAKKGKVKVGGKTCSISLWTDESVTCTVKVGLPPQAYDIKVIRREPKGAKPITSQGAFTMMAPRITSIAPASGAASEEITIYGNYFGSKKGKVYLEYEQRSQLKKRRCTVTEWSMYDTMNGQSRITFIVPKPLREVLAGPLNLTIVNKVGKDSTTFTME